MEKQMQPGDQLPDIVKKISQKRINAWAAISGDYNPLHVDPQYARKTRFKKTIAHGPLLLAFLNQLMMKCFGPAWMTHGKMSDIRFIAPIYPGDSIRISGSITKVSKQKAAQIVKCELYIEKDTGKRAVVGTAECRTPLVAP